MPNSADTEARAAVLRASAAAYASWYAHAVSYDWGDSDGQASNAAYSSGYVAYISAYGKRHPHWRTHASTAASAATAAARTGHAIRKSGTDLIAPGLTAAVDSYETAVKALVAAIRVEYAVLASVADGRWSTHQGHLGNARARQRDNHLAHLRPRLAHHPGAGGKRMGSDVCHLSNGCFGGQIGGQNKQRPAECQALSAVSGGDGGELNSPSRERRTRTSTGVVLRLISPALPAEHGSRPGQSQRS